MLKLDIETKEIAVLLVFACLCAACDDIAFTPDVEPLEIEEIRDLPSPDDLPDPLSGTLSELEYWEEQLGFGVNGRPSLDEYFDPYHQANPVTGEEHFGATEELVEAAEIIYANEGDIDELARQGPDNPINYWDDDPITILEGDARLQMAFVMASSLSKPHIGRFLNLIGANPSLEWNYEPAWVAAQMRLHPHELLQAKWEVLHQYVSDPDVFDFVQDADITGPTD